MLTLYHFPLCPRSRLIRVLLREFDINFELVKIDYWQRPAVMLQLNPAGELPIIVSSSHHIFCGLYPIIEYLLELEPSIHLNLHSLEERAEMRRLVSWAMDKFQSEVTGYILEEKMLKILTRVGSPRTEFIRAAKINNSYHIEYLTSLISARGYLASDQLSIADIAFASQISVLDYFGEINWSQNEMLKEWYAPIKSRPSFRSLLEDRLASLAPASHYTDLDF